MLVKTKEILEILNTLKATVAARDLNPVYRQVAFSNGYAWSFDGECGLIRTCPSQWSMLINADSLIACLSKYDTEEVDIDTTSGQAIILSGRSKASLPSADPRLFPEIFPKGYTAFCEATNLSSVIKRVLSLVDRSGNFAQVGIRGKYVYATDGRRTSRIAIDKPAENRPVALSLESAKTFAQQGEPIKTFATDSQIVGHFNHGLCVAAFVHSKVPFPAIDRIASEEAKPENVQMLPVGFDRALERAAVICAAGGGVTLESTGKELSVRAVTKDVGSIEETFDWDFRKFVIGVNPQHIRDALKFSTSIDWTSCLTADPRVIRFVLPDADHFVGLMEL